MTASRYHKERVARGSRRTVAARLGAHHVTLAKRETGKMRITKEAWLALMSLPKVEEMK
jgi:hypothetical protein